MKLKLLAYTQMVGQINPINQSSILISQVARCSTDRMELEKTEADLYKSVENLWKQKHGTPFEFIHFAFLIKDVSRSLTHQLVRHRLCSFVQQSQRYVKYSEDSDVWNNMIIPLDLLMTGRNAEAREKIRETFKVAQKAYQDLLKLGVNSDDARCILPNAMPSTVCMSFNLRHFLEVIYPLRSAHKASKEIQYLVNEMMANLVRLYKTDHVDNIMYQFLVYYVKALYEIRGYDDVFYAIKAGNI